MTQANGKTCVWCHKPLVGRQAKFCSDSCRTLEHRGRSPEYAQRQKESRLAYAQSEAGRAWRAAYQKAYTAANPVDPAKQAEYRAKSYAKHAAKRREQARVAMAAKRKSDREFAEQQRAASFAYYQKRMAEDPAFRAAKNLRRRLLLAIQAAKSEKSCGTMQLVGCSWSDLIAHLESQFQPGMTWENYGLFGWHIDHIIPCASFDLTDPEQQKECFHYTNLQPLWALDNIKKGASRS